jgi:hypothetical protein
MTNQREKQFIMQADSNIMTPIMTFQGEIVKPIMVGILGAQDNIMEPIMSDIMAPIMGTTIMDATDIMSPCANGSANRDSNSPSGAVLGALQVFWEDEDRDCDFCSDWRVAA